MKWIARSWHVDRTGIGFALVSAIAVVLAAVAWWEREHRVGVAKLFQEAVRDQHQLIQTLVLERQRTAQLRVLAAGKTREVDVLVDRLKAEAAATAQLQHTVDEQREQMNRLQTELLLAQKTAASSGVSKSLSRDTVELTPVTVSASGPTRTIAKVVQVNPEWEFVVLDAGWNRVEIGDVLKVYRQENLVAQVQVERVQQHVAAARVLPTYQTADIALIHNQSPGMQPFKKRRIFFKNKGAELTELFIIKKIPAAEHIGHKVSSLYTRGIERYDGVIFIFHLI